MAWIENDTALAVSIHAILLRGKTIKTVGSEKYLLSRAITEFNLLNSETWPMAAKVMFFIWVSWAMAAKVMFFT
jgi:hypothetical protein